MRVGCASLVDLRDEDLRLNAGLYLAEDALAWSTLKRSGLPTTTLGKLVKAGGLFRGPIFRRVYAAGPEQGRPYLSPDDIGAADIRPTSWLSESLGTLLDDLTLREGMILVTRSGMNLGRVYWADGRLDGMVASDDLIRVVVEPEQAPPGYVFAFLASKYGKIAIRRQIFGGSIKHVEPAQLRDLAVPRMGKGTEVQVHQDVDSAGSLYAQMQTSLNEATKLAFQESDLFDVYGQRWMDQPRDLGFEVRGLGGKTIRALNYSPRALHILQAIRAKPHKRLGDICRGGQLSSGVRFKRIDAEESCGVRLVGQRHGFWLRPEGRWIAAEHAPPDIFAQDETVMIASQGTLGENEVYARALLVTGQWKSFAYTQHFLRVVSGDPTFSGAFLFSILRSDPYFRCLRSMSVGGKQQDIHPELLHDLPIPAPGMAARERIAEVVRDALRARDKAERLIEAAIQRVESAIEGST